MPDRPRWKRHRTARGYGGRRRAMSRSDEGRVGPPVALRVLAREPRIGMLRGVLPLGAAPLSQFVQGFLRDGVQPPGMYVLLDLPIPHVAVMSGEPCPEGGQVFGREAPDRGFNLA